LVCEIVGRDLLVCDSFQCLPQITEEDSGHISPIHAAKGFTTSYEEGDFAVSLDSVKANIERFGKIGRCRFDVGYFE
jgi:hypothetical protein